MWFIFISSSWLHTTQIIIVYLLDSYEYELNVSGITFINERSSRSYPKKYAHTQLHPKIWYSKSIHKQSGTLLLWEQKHSHLHIYIRHICGVCRETIDMQRNRIAHKMFQKKVSMWEDMTTHIRTPDATWYGGIPFSQICSTRIWLHSFVMVLSSGWVCVWLALWSLSWILPRSSQVIAQKFIHKIDQTQCKRLQYP